jgi:CHAD domain-containing protein
MTLRQRFLASSAALLDQIPAVRDADVRAIHEARVATRRMRAALPILSACYPHPNLKTVAGTLKKAGRALGRVRDLDVAVEVIAELERTSPPSAARAAEVRRAIVAKQLTARRRLVKVFDDLPLDQLQSLAADLARSHRTGSMGGRPECDGAIRDALREQAAALRQAIAHGSGVYFPKRAHAVRIDAKKLRYVLEMTKDPQAVAHNGVTVLRKAQDVLGKLHDRDVLRKRFARLADDEEDSSLAAALVAIDAECQELFATYLSRRPALLEVCDGIDRFVARMRWPYFSTSSFLRVAAVALPAAAVLAARADVPHAALARVTRLTRTRG